MSGRQVAEETVGTFTRMFDLSLSKDKMMAMMPGLLLYLAREPEMVTPVLDRMLPMMKDMNIAVNDDLLVEMMPSVVKAVDRAPALGGKVFERMVPMMKAFGLKMNLYIMGKVMGMMMAMTFRHPRIIPGMMKSMPRML
ncbi:MAG: hypothetical protein R6X13_09735 [bacterium]